MTTPPPGAHKTLQIEANPNVALITGITGQDGSYLAEFLLGKGYTVHGIIRRSSSFNTGRIEHLYRDKHDQDVKLFLHYGDLTDSSNLSRLVEKIAPSEIYNLGAQSHVAVSFQVPEYTAQVDGLGTLRLLDAIKETGVDTRVMQASQGCVEIPTFGLKNSLNVATASTVLMWEALRQWRDAS